MDPRIARTRHSLQRALFDLLGTRDLEDVTIADIVEHAGVNRSSFYQHYSDKDTLLADAIDSALAGDGAALPPLMELIETDAIAAIVAYLGHFEGNIDVYARVFGPHGSLVAVARLQQHVQGLAREGIESSRTQVFDGMPIDVAAAGIAGSVVAVVGAWIAMEPRPGLDVAAAWIWRVLLGPGAEQGGADPGCGSA
ncbi:TetR/AcrR family transcriptional regulator [Litorihabitans aurantiacus]|uniref:HTH tetR-type domain-containing protein n=1 Tax=Litorihabitans aurantiacus TaxID=1930061 RepID=A0AA37XG66_9MICO|nr:TetR/AcrR family transcriptional regulator [Litorihabitans aurantiacus]GMA32953.1 hypothetical protein GCM10025875_29450 [Litorihabitans aurantiacus]